jgi:hypothetical protein
LIRPVGKAIALALALMATALPAAALAKPGYRVTPPLHVIQLFPAHGTHGYLIDIAAIDGVPELSAIKQSRAGSSFVVYRQTRQRVTGGDLDADFGKAGTMKARFAPDKVREEKLPKGCVGGPIVVETGHFVGSIAFHGADGFTSFRTHRLPGAVTRWPRIICRRRPRLERSVARTRPEGVLGLIAGTPSGSTSFDARAEPAEQDTPPTTAYSAFNKYRDGAVEILEDVEVAASSPLAIPDLTATLPATVTIEPPAPFSARPFSKRPPAASRRSAATSRSTSPSPARSPSPAPGSTRASAATTPARHRCRRRCDPTARRNSASTSSRSKAADPAPTTSADDR